MSKGILVAFRQAAIGAVIFGSVAGMGAAVAVAQTESPNDTARYLAGMSVSNGSPLAKLQPERAWQIHTSAFNKAWAGLHTRQLSKIRLWSSTNLKSRQSTMLYMFSGPDFLYADTFFPGASTYVFAGLEPVGSMPNVAALSPGGRAQALWHLRASLHTILRLSFFITRDMSVKLNTGRLRGTLPILYVFLARSGKTIKEVSFVTVDKDGAVKPRTGAVLRGQPSGVRIKFSGKNGKPQTLYYFSTDLSNGGVARTGFLKFLETLGPADSFVKSASYLMHIGAFSTIRSFLLKQSMTIVQDDSGIPLRFYPKDQWKFQPFGNYIQPISIFANRYQHDMLKLFKSAPAKPIGFGIGYRWQPRVTNVLLATKKK